MFKYLPELVSSYFIAREMASAGKGAQFWESAYHAKTNDLLACQSNFKAEQDLVMRMREEAVIAHNNLMELMQQAQESEKEKLTLIKAYTELVEQIEEEGFRVNENNELVLPEELEILTEEDEEGVVDESSPLDKDEP